VDRVRPLVREPLGAFHRSEHGGGVASGHRTASCRHSGADELTHGFLGFQTCRGGFKYRRDFRCRGFEHHLDRHKRGFSKMNAVIAVLLLFPPVAALLLIVAFTKAPKHAVNAR
jgi:hypothetical protein